MDIITILFSIIALICGFLTLFWMLKLKNQVEQGMSKTYLISAVIAVSFLFSFPLWNLFVDVFDFVTPVIRKVSYLFFSAGYFGVLLVSYLAVSEVKGMRDYLESLNKEVRRQTRRTKMYKEMVIGEGEKTPNRFVSKVKQLEKTHQEYEEFKAKKEAEMNNLKTEIERLRNGSSS